MHQLATRERPKYQFIARKDRERGSQNHVPCTSLTAGSVHLCSRCRRPDDLQLGDLRPVQNLRPFQGLRARQPGQVMSQRDRQSLCERRVQGECTLRRPLTTSVAPARTLAVHKWQAPPRKCQAPHKQHRACAARPAITLVVAGGVPALPLALLVLDSRQHA